MIPNVLLGGYLVFWAALGRAPLDPGNWVLASILPLTFVGGLVFGRRAFPLSSVSYALIAGFLVLHTVGAHYTYSQVPFGHWLQTVFGLERNDFDRVVHFAFGLCLTYPLLEVFRRRTGARGLLLFYLAFMTQLALAGAWEIIEAGVAQLARPDLGIAFVGAQGDPWDAQHDMLAATVGTVVALLVSASTSWLTRSGRFEGLSRLGPPPRHASRRVSASLLPTGRSLGRDAADVLRGAGDAEDTRTSTPPPRAQPRR